VLAIVVSHLPAVAGTAVGLPLLLEAIRAVDRLIAARHKRHLGLLAARCANSVEAFVGDLGQPDTLRPALEGVERAFLLAPSSLPNKVALETTFVNAAKQAGVKQIIKLSALGATSQAACLLLRWHGQVEQHIEASGLAYTHLRPGPFMQNLLFDADSIAHAGAIYEPLGDMKAAFVDVCDVAAVAARVLTEPGHEARTYDITGPEALSYSDIAAKLSAALGKPVTYFAVTDAQAAQAMKSAGMPDFLIHGFITFYHYYRQGLAAVTGCSVELITGKSPRTLDAFIAEHLRAFRESK
jgi:uncharacterized protein YbjT (DUF2867 family)